MTETIVRVRPGTTGNRYGGADKDWATAERVQIPGCLVAPRVEPEDRANGREAAVVGWTVYAPDGTDVAAIDRVEVRGVPYEVDTAPADWSGGWDWRPGVVLQLRKVEG